MGKNTHNETPVNEERNTQKTGMTNRLIVFSSGIIIGTLLTGIIAWMSMPSMMLVEHQSRYDSVEETSNQLRASIEANGWQCLGIRNMNKSMAKHGVQMDTQVRIVELCNTKYAKDVLLTNPEVVTLMPCAWGVYKGRDGKVYISGMNMGLMGKMFGGNIAKIMGGAVSKDEKKMLKDIIRH